MSEMVGIFLAATDTLHLFVRVVSVNPKVRRALDADAGSHHLKHELLLGNVHDHGHEVLNVPAIAVDVGERIIRDGCAFVIFVYFLRRRRLDVLCVFIVTVFVWERVLPANLLEIVDEE